LAAAMFGWPSRRSRLMARLHSDAITRGAFPVLTRDDVLLQVLADLSRVS